MAKQDHTLVDSISKVPLFAECSRRQLRTIAASSKHLHKESGEVIIKEGNGGIAFFLIVDGTVDICRDGESIATLSAGDYFGETALLADQPRNATAIAKTDVGLLTFTQWAFKSVVVNDAKLCYRLLRTMAGRQARLVPHVQEGPVSHGGATPAEPVPTTGSTAQSQ